jgi:hypothetical protein
VGGAGEQDRVASVLTTETRGKNKTINHKGHKGTQRLIPQGREESLSSQLDSTPLKHGVNGGSGGKQELEDDAFGVDFGGAMRAGEFHVGVAQRLVFFIRSGLRVESLDAPDGVADGGRGLSAIGAGGRTRPGCGFGLCGLRLQFSSGSRVHLH